MNVDLTTRVIELSRENGELQDRVARQDKLIRGLEARFQRLSAEDQRKAVNFEMVLLVLMVARGLDLFEASIEEIEALPTDRQLVFDGGTDGKSMRVRVMTAEQADAAVHPERRN